MTQNKKEKPQPPIFIVVPGIMGTELLVEEGHFAWNILIAGAVTGHAYTGEHLTNPNLLIGDLLGRGLDNIHVPGYGWFLDQLARYGHVCTLNYDWRYRVKYHAKPLAKGILKLHENNSNRPIILIGHSMGGLICLRAIYQYEGVKEAITTFVPLAVPVGGSTMAPERAYNGFGWGGNQDEIKEVLRGFGSVMNDLWPKYPWFHEHRRDPLIRSPPPAGIPLPPPTHEVLALVQRATPEDYQGMADYAREETANYKFKGFRCDKIKTSHSMKKRVFTDGYRVSIRERRMGDGTVLAAQSIGTTISHAVKHRRFVNDQEIFDKIVEGMDLIEEEEQQTQSQLGQTTQACTCGGHINV
ncbi:Alpha/Beta hydrolase protein [Trichoderma evansii]